jgi:uncharacterized protein YdeI (YjbR/CyaY-like superfamily)
MPTLDPRIDAYIAKSPEFARPILLHLRAVVHAACPDVEETMKWSMPAFMHHGILCGMGAFKQHCTFGFWKSQLIFDRDSGKSVAAMGDFGRITQCRDLPTKKVLVGYVKQAMKLNEAGVKVAKPKKKSAAPLKVPADLAAALKKDRAAKTTFDNFSPCHRKEYIEWITRAKQPATRAKRLAQAIEWLAEGKKRNWKYENC